MSEAQHAAHRAEIASIVLLDLSVRHARQMQSLVRPRRVFAQIPQPRRVASIVAMSILLICIKTRVQNTCEAQRSTCGAS